MLYIRINKKTHEFEGFSDKFDEIYENIEITGEEHKNYIESQFKPEFYIYEEDNNIYCDVFLSDGKRKINILKISGYYHKKYCRKPVKKNEKVDR